jgi:hypothetical protein
MENYFHDNNSSENYYSSNLITQKVKGASNERLFDESKAFMLGNLFENLYVPERDVINYPIKTTNKRQSLMKELQIYEFIVHEIHLYLDTHPNDQKMLYLFHHYNKEAKKAREVYEFEFGSLTVSELEQANGSWSWVDTPWPWEKQ